jgi:hypothetical protein
VYLCVLCIYVGPLPTLTAGSPVLCSYCISMNWLKAESSQAGSFQLTTSHYLSWWFRCLERTPSWIRLPKWRALHYEKSRITATSVLMEVTCFRKLAGGISESNVCGPLILCKHDQFFMLGCKIVCFICTLTNVAV